MFNMNTKGVYTIFANQLIYIARSSDLKDCHINFGITLGLSIGYNLEIPHNELTRYRELARIVMQQAEVNVIKLGWI